MDIENLAVSAVAESISLTDTMTPFIKSGDKEPVWDGNIYIYKDKRKTKEDIKKVPVQVKGKKNNSQWKDTISFPMEIAELKDYLADGGVLLFVVYFDEAGTRKQIYYTSLLPVKIRLLLEGLGSGQKDKSVKLKKFPIDNNQKTSILYDFHSNMKKQTSFCNAKLLSFDELVKNKTLESVNFSITSFGNINSNPNELLFNSDDIYLYAKIKNSTIPIPLLEILTAFKTVDDISVKISVNDKAYYQCFEREKTKEEIKIHIGNSTCITLQKNDQSIKIQFKPTNILQEALVDFPFLIAVLKYNHIFFGEKKIKIVKDNVGFTEKRIKSLQDKLSYYQKLNELFDALRLNKNKDISKMSEEDYRNADRLYQAIIQKKRVPNLRNDIPQLTLLDFLDTKLALIFQPTEVAGTYIIKDYFHDDSVVFYRVMDNGDRVPTSKYVQFTSKNFIEIGNIDYDDVLDSFKRYCDEPTCIEEATLLLLQMINAFDESSETRTDIIEHAERFAKWLLEIQSPNNTEIATINLLQIKRRTRELNDEEKQKLIEISEEFTDKDNEMGRFLKIGANILLGNLKVAEYHFRKLDKGNQIQFKGVPIFRLWNKE